jgi:hypothetical protein
MSTFPRALNLQTPIHAIPLLSLSMCMWYIFGILFAAELLLLARKQRVNGRIELVAALEKIEFEDENVLCHLAAELLDEGTSRRGRTTCSNQHTVNVFVGMEKTHQSQ